MIIRKAEKSDLQQILTIEQQSFTLPWTYEAMRHEIDHKYSYFEVAVIDDTIVGFYILRLLTGGDAELINIAVNSLYRRKKIADALMSSMLNYAKNSGLQSIYLEVRKSNEAAIMLYRKHGFISLGIRKDYYDKPVEDAVTMVLRCSE